MTTETTERKAGFAVSLENDNAPVLGRMYEVQSARELEMQESIEASVQSLQAGVAEVLHNPPHAETENLDGKQHVRPESERVMPFIGQILQHTSGESIVIERILDLAEDLYLADHVFVHAQGVKPLSACLPVLPMTFSLEVMAEVAACLVPGHGLIGLEDIKATRWIDLADTDKLALRITAGKARPDPARQLYRIEAAIYINEQAMPAISATVLFAPHYRLELLLGFNELTNPSRYPLTAEQIYQERFLFHGPSFQCLVGEILLGDRGAVGELVTRPAGSLFKSVPKPQLLLDPALLDAVGQIIGVWAMARERYVFPVGIKKLELYQPTPPAGTRVPVRIEITRDEVKTLHADIEVQDGAGNVWMRIHDWGMWKFRWPQKLLDFRRLPTRYLVSDPVMLPSLAPATICQMLSSSDLTGFDAGLLARFYLHVDELSAFTDKAGVPQRQHQWLLGRIAAKDAVRAWIAMRMGTEEMLHPASFTIENNEQGQPVVRHLPAFEPLPKISIAHCEDRAIAIARSGSVGVDIERISARGPGFLETIAGEIERALLTEHVDMSASSEKREEWITRLWCAKEVVGKLMGTGVDVPQHFEVTAIATDGTIQVRPQGSDRPAFVNTTRDSDFIIAHAITST